MDYATLAQLLFGTVTQTPAQMEERFPPRELEQGAKVTRIAPSPTGFIHFGNLFPATVSDILAQQSGGVFYLRIEDTDSERKVEGAVDLILAAFAAYEISFDEGALADGKSRGAYGPYYQSLRVPIYHVYAKRLVEQGLAYPCFCSKETLLCAHEKQVCAHITPGYYGAYAPCRNLCLDQIKENLAAKMPYTLRLRSPGKEGARIRFTDAVKGDLELDENYMDAVLLKSDGVPTYHFAHVVDDHLMRTTHVVRGEEWLSTLPLHLQLFDLLGFRRPVYVHIAHLMKQDGAGKRKLSKRRDPEASLEFYHTQGYPARGVRAYVLGVLNSNFEQWQRENPDEPLCAFPFSVKKMSASGALFDLSKLADVSKNCIARMSADEVLQAVLCWSREFHEVLYEHLRQDQAYARAIFAIGRGGEKPRKDFAKWSDVPEAVSFFYDDLFSIEDSLPAGNAAADAGEIVSRYAKVYAASDDRDAWFSKIQVLAEELGYAAKPKEYKEDSARYRGHVGDVSAALRLALTGRLVSPDLYDCMRVLGEERVKARLDAAKF